MTSKKEDTEIDWIDFDDEKPGFGKKIIIENGVGIYWAIVTNGGVYIENKIKDFVRWDQLWNWTNYPTDEEKAEKILGMEQLDN